MQKLVSILIATRYRLQRLLKTIDSFYETANPENFEILLRIDDDDQDTLSQLSVFKQYNEVSYIIGPRYTGYSSHHVFMEELAAIAKGKWFFFYDDDATIIGKKWDKQLANVPTEGRIVHPEFYWLGQSKYGSGSCDPVAICVPNKCWEKYSPRLQFPIDDKLQRLLISNGWQNHWLKGIVSFHDRDNEDVLTQHRQLNG